MANEEVINTLTVNKMEDAAEKDWSISGGISKPIKQARVLLNSGKEYEYASYYPVEEGDVVIIGHKVPDRIGAENWKSNNTGEMGVVTAVGSKLIIKKQHAVELDLVFTDWVTKKTITSCIKYLNKPEDEDTLRELLQHGTHAEYVWPLSYLVRKLLMAASIIAHPEYADKEAIEKAKAYIHKSQKVPAAVKKLRSAPVSEAERSIVNYDLYIHKEQDGEEYYIKAGEVSKFAFMGAISIMVRGGFANLLEAFLSAKPPIGKYYDEMIEYLGDTGDKATLDIIKSYK